jgi:hypothetical protein
MELNMKLHSFKRQSAGVILASLMAAASMTAAQAASNCGLTGKWHTDALLGSGQQQSIVDCTFVIKANGTYAATNCGSWIDGQPPNFVSASGSIRANAQCKLSGVLKAQGFPDTTIRGGFVNGDVATLVGTRGDENSPTQVRILVLVRERIPSGAQ